MLNSLYSGNRLRVDLSKIKKDIDIPNLLQLQKKSFDNFLNLDNSNSESGIERVFRSIFPIHDAQNRLTLEYVSSEITKPKYTIRECIERELTYSVNLKMKIRLVLHERDEKTGEKINLNIAQYIAFDLGLDNLSFHEPLSNQILSEAVEHSNDEGFKAEEYFTHHSDILISTLAVKLSVDRFQLSKSMQMKEREVDLRDRIMHLILDYRMDYVEQHLKELQASLSTESDLNKTMEIMGEIKKMQDMRNVLARKLGNDIVV